MILTFAEDFTSSIELDSQLIGTPDSGLFWNRGVHPMFTIENLLAFLPKLSFTFADYVAGTTYSKSEMSRKKSDIVTYEGKIYLSIASDNVGNQPDISSTKWLETNIDSLRIRSFLWTVYDNYKSALSLTRRLIENQFIYNAGEDLNTLSNDFAGWAFEPKGSDYVKIRINQMCLQANTTTPQSVYVINQGRLIDTLTLNPNSGILEFEDVGYEFSGKGTFYFVFESQEVVSDFAYNDALKYQGFVAYPISGVGSIAKDADYSISSAGNGLNFNITCRLDSDLYIQNNEIDLAKFIQSQFEMDCIRMMLHNANNRSNIQERLQKQGLNDQLMATESLDLSMNTIAKSYNSKKKQALDAISRTFDRMLKKKRSFRTTRSSV